MTPPPAAFADIVTVELPVVDGVIDVTVVPDAIALGLVVSWIVMPAVILVVTTPFGKVRVLLPLPVVGVAKFVGVPASVTNAHDPVLNSVAAFILVAKASVLVVVAALVGFWIPEYDPGGEVEGVAI